jgi:hypothetical protein
MGEFFYNNTKHSSAQQTLFMVDTGRNPCMGFEPQQPHSTLELANEFAEHIALGIEEAKVALTKAKDDYTIYYNRRCEPAQVFVPGDRVWLDGSDITTFVWCLDYHWPVCYSCNLHWIYFYLVM